MADLDRASLGIFPHGNDPRIANLLGLLRKVDPEVFVRNLAEEIDTHGLNASQLRFLEDTVMHAADESKLFEKVPLEKP